LTTSTARFARSADGVDREEAKVTISNRSKSLAFFIRLQINMGNGEELLPVLWDDNYISLLPGETREIRATYRRQDRGSRGAVISISGWNVNQLRIGS
jgi:exo-1,4-beta-D-glucosaminidase